MESLVKNMEILATISIFPKSCSDSMSTQFHVHKNRSAAHLGKMRSILGGHVPIIHGKSIVEAFQNNPDETKKSNLKKCQKFFHLKDLNCAHPGNDCGI